MKLNFLSEGTTLYYITIYENYVQQIFLPLPITYKQFDNLQSDIRAA